MFSKSIKKFTSSPISQISPINPVESGAALGLKSALKMRQQGGGTFGYTDDSMLPTSAFNPQMQSMSLGKGAALGNQSLPSMDGDAGMDPNSNYAQRQKRLAGMMVGSPGIKMKGSF